MKKPRIISSALCVVMLLSIFSINSFAYQAKSDLRTTYIGENGSRFTTQQSTEVSPNVVKKLASGVSNYKYYDDLSSIEKDIYNAFIKTKGGLNTKGVINVTFSKGQSLSGSVKPLLDAEINKAIAAAAGALTDDLPEYFWVYPLPFEITYTATGIMPMKTSSITLTLNLNYIPYSSLNEINREYNALLAAVNNFKVGGTTTYEKAASIHDNLCELASYDMSIDENTAPDNSKVFFPSSALLYPYQTVCDGYSKAYKMLCDKNNIPCIIVVGYSGGGGHAWNYVQMDNGKWYAVDTTWDDLDGSNKICTDEFFLVGNYTIDTMGMAFSESHEATGDRYYGVTLVYPELNRTKYIATSDDISLFGDVNIDGKLSIIDAKLILEDIAEVKPLRSAGKISADYNMDNVISILDAKQILIAITNVEV